MKVLFCAYDRPGHIATGPNAWIQRLIPDLRSTYNLDVHTLFIYNGEIKDCPTLSFFQSKGLPILTIDREEVCFVEDQIRQILQLIKTYNFTILVANLVIPALYAARFLKPYHVPVIGVLHSNDNFYKGVINKFLKGQKKDRLTAVVSVSNYIKGLAGSSEAGLKNVVIPCGTPVPIEKVKKSSLNRLKIIYAGRLVIEAKQILKLTESFCHASKTNENYEFNIYGDGDQEDNVREIIERNLATNQVKLHQALPPSEILKKISEHHVFTLLSDYEGMPLSLMEAMACGVVPVCYIGEGGIEEIIEHGVNGFVVKDREEDYQSKLKSLVDDYKLWVRMSEKAIQTIKERYDSSKTHHQWFELLNEYENHAVKKVKIPLIIKLGGELLHYGDNRKPSMHVMLKKYISTHWLKFRMLARPRARLRSLLKNEK